MGRLGIGIGIPGRGGVLPFSPLSIAGCVAWYRADTGITLNGSRVSGWDDISGTGDANKNLTEADAGQQPLFNASSANLNGQPSLTWAIARNDRLTSGVWGTPMPATCTWFFVGRVTAYDASGTIATNGSAAPNSHVAYYTTDGLVHSYAGTDVITNPFQLPALPQNIIRASVFSRTAPKIYHNALTAKALSGGATDTGAQTLTALVLGGQRGDATGFTLAGEIAEVIGYNRALTNGEIGSVLAYLGTRYGVTIGA